MCGAVLASLLVAGVGVRGFVGVVFDGSVTVSCSQARRCVAWFAGISLDSGWMGSSLAPTSVLVVRGWPALDVFDELAISSYAILLY